MPSGDADIAERVRALYDPGTLGLHTVAVDAIPRLRSGKVDRRALSSLSGPGTATVEPGPA
ncbi:hypothetical protein [Dactylosporangium salmoneum]|uniref:AMP-binding enzyme C-terminal domain-containing protein n=1 Tax=Dactylosporangium salmoneum TaxID=53361 RepID=A0ABN3G0R4_9ACTN